MINSLLGYINVNLEELTLVNFFQDYCDINETKIWPSLVGEIKKEKSWSFLSPFQVFIGWAGISHRKTHFLGSSSRGNRKAYLTLLQHKPDIHSHFREREYKGSFFRWETEAGHAVSFSQSSCVNPAHIFYVSSLC